MIHSFELTFSFLSFLVSLDFIPNIFHLRAARILNICFGTTQVADLTLNVIPTSRIPATYELVLAQTHTYRVAKTLLNLLILEWRKKFHGGGGGGGA